MIARWSHKQIIYYYRVINIAYYRRQSSSVAVLVDILKIDFGTAHIGTLFVRLSVN